MLRLLGKKILILYFYAQKFCKSGPLGTHANLNMYILLNTGLFTFAGVRTETIYNFYTNEIFKIDRTSSKYSMLKMSKNLDPEIQNMCLHVITNFYI